MSEMFDDLLAAQKEMPNLQKSAINPHFKNRYVPLEELIPAILPVLNAHNFVLLQAPAISETGLPSLKYELRHKSGESVTGEMLLLAQKDDPQGQGSAITYARRYSLMALLGLTADVDDDAEQTRNARQGPVPTTARTPAANPAPVCPVHNASRLQPAGVSKKSGKPYDAFYGCTNRDCAAGDKGRGWTMFKADWEAQLQLARGEQQDDVDFHDLPHEA